MKRLGKVCTQGTVEGHTLNIKWDVMDVKVPIISVRKLVRDNHNVRFRRKGGYILNLETRDKIPFFEYQGVYYLKMKFTQPTEPPEICEPCSESVSSFPRPVA